jgi:hypothetical protein
MRYGNPQGEVRSGGAIRNEGDLVLTNVIVRENQASAGGGILNDGTLSISNSTISDNLAKGGGDYFTECKTGGGMKIMSGTVTIENSTISHNQSRGKGGGIHIACLGELTLTNSTISGNYSFEVVVESLLTEWRSLPTLPLRKTKPPMEEGSALRVVGKKML